MNWDDIRIFLAVYRYKNLRAAATELKINHATVLRRLDKLESYMGSRLFERLPSGFSATDAGLQLLPDAEHMEQHWYRMERNILGRDKMQEGEVRVTFPEPLASAVFVKVLSEFCEQYPKVEIELIVSNEKLNLTRREADIAIRVTNKPPEHLVGRELCRLAVSSYATQSLIDRLQQGDGEKSEEPISEDPIHWLGWDDVSRSPWWVRESAYTEMTTKHRINDPHSQMVFAKAGQGIAMLPCYLADNEADLHRVPGAEVIPRYGIWMLTHPDLRFVARIKVLMDFINEKFKVLKPLFEGEKKNGV